MSGLTGFLIGIGVYALAILAWAAYNDFWFDETVTPEEYDDLNNPPKKERPHG